MLREAWFPKSKKKKSVYKTHKVARIFPQRVVSQEKLL